MIGYWDDEQQTRETLDRAGWLRTGDLGIIDEEGYAHITGRLKDMIIRGGENIRGNSKNIFSAMRKSWRCKSLGFRTGNLARRSVPGSN
jgi:long-subunit acyl-CoA synthetase (AMP-forming)